ncbi:Asp-tRNA(Asn)/Glu-tRNA(Gln) amidotransferase subunit GatA, partial [Candidatus Saccharibacteria bacterium]|nr:Asp-tRNA(Asn)/Glu-tRNA(Gln) amidotransferase subunit GatA [Candidatus Saccharibacteria bacterium]
MNNWPPISEIVSKVHSGESTATSLVAQALELIKKNKEFDALISTVSERAQKRAVEIDEKIKRGEKAGRLAGVPFIAKDNFLTYGSETTAASNILHGFHAPYQSTAIERLEAEGAICVAKANLDAFAHGSSTENSDFFVTKNPYDKERVPGGSSGGSAAAVALQIVPFALGTDTGGSIRLPASFCGLVGYKPSYGLVSRSGVIAMASSTDVIGPLTRNVTDAALVLDVMAGKDELDSTTIERDKQSYDSEPMDMAGKKVGIVREYFGEGLDDKIKERVNEAIEKLRQAGAEIEETSLPNVPLALAAYYIICPAEVSSNLARYDGQRFGYSDDKATNLDESYELSREHGFGAEAKRRIMIGAHVLSSGYYDAYYKKAQTVRTKVRKEFDQAFSKYNFLIGPTAPMTAFKIGERTGDPLQMYLSDIMTVAANISGNPAISL